MKGMRKKSAPPDFRILAYIGLFYFCMIEARRETSGISIILYWIATSYRTNCHWFPINFHCLLDWMNQCRFRKVFWQMPLTCGCENCISQHFCRVIASGDSKASEISKEEKHNCKNCFFTWRAIGTYWNLQRPISTENSVCSVSLR